MDGLLRCRGGVLNRLLHAGDQPVSVRVAQITPERVLFGARARTDAAAVHGIERMRFALGVDEDLSAFRRRFARDPLIGRSIVRRPSGTARGCTQLAAVSEPGIVERADGGWLR